MSEISNDVSVKIPGLGFEEESIACDLESSEYKSDIIISKDSTSENTRELRSEQTEDGIYEFISKKYNDLLNISRDLSRDQNMYGAESKIVERPKNIDANDDDSDILVISGVNHKSVNTGEKEKDLVKPLDIEMKQTIGSNDDYNSYKSDVILLDYPPVGLFQNHNMYRIESKVAEVPESACMHDNNSNNLDYQSSVNLDEIRKYSNDVYRCGGKLSPDNSNEELKNQIKQREQTIMDAYCTERDKYSSVIVDSDLEEGEIITLDKSSEASICKEGNATQDPCEISDKIKSFLDIISKNLRDNDEGKFAMLTQKFDSFRKERAAVKSREKFREELYNKLENFKSEYKGIERKLDDASEFFTIDDVLAFVLELKKELTCFQQSLEELTARRLLDKSKNSNKLTTSFRSDQQHPEKTTKTALNKHSFRSKNCTSVQENSHTLCKKIKSRGSYEPHSELCPWEAVKTTDQSGPKYFNGLDKEICETLHKKQCNLSAHKRNFQQSPVRNFRTSSRKGGKETSESISEERRSDFRRYSSELNRYAKMRGVSKSYKDTKKIVCSKSIPKNCTGHVSHSTKQSSNSRKESKNNLMGRYSKEVGESRNERKYKPRNHSTEKNFSNDSNDSSSDIIPIYSDSNSRYGRVKYLQTTPKIVASDDNDGVSSRKKRYREINKETRYETDASSTSSADSELYELNSLGKEHDAYKKNTEKKRTRTLVSRQMDIIKKHVLRKDDSVKSPRVFPLASYIREKSNSKNDLTDRKSNDEINSEDGMTSINKNEQKRKNNELYPDAPCKRSRTRNDTDVHGNLKSEHSTESCNAKLQGFATSPSPYNSTSSVEINRRDVKEIGNRSKQTFRDEMKNQNERGCSNFDNKYADNTDVVQVSGNEAYEYWLRKALNTGKDIESYFSALKKKRRESPSAELIFKKKEKSPVVRTVPAPKYSSGYSDKIHPEYVSDKRRHEHTKTDLVLSVNKDKVKLRVLQTDSKKDKRSLSRETTKKTSIEDKREAACVSNKKTYISEKPNLEMREKKVSGRTPVALNRKDRNDEFKTERYEKRKQ